MQRQNIFPFLRFDEKTRVLACVCVLFTMTRKEKKKAKTQNATKQFARKKNTTEREQELEVGCQVGDVLLLQSFIAL